MPEFIMMLPSGKKIDLTKKVKTAESENDIKTALIDALKSETQTREQIK